MHITNSHIFITGGAGFIGSVLTGKLVESNKVTVFDTLDRNALAATSFAEHPNLTVITGDVMDKAALLQHMVGADYIIHCAGIAGIQTVGISPTRTMAVNIIGSHNVLEAAREVAPACKRIVCFSTSEVFGNMAFTSKETDASVIGSAGKSRWTYAVSKLAEEHLALAYHSEHGLKTTVLRPFNIYGPGQVGEGALKIFVQKALKNQTINIFGTGAQIRAWCYVDDMVEGLLLCLTRPEAVGESFNIGNTRSVQTIYGLANTVIRVLGSTSVIEYKPALSADIELRIPCVDKAKELLDFEAAIDLEEGILRTAAFYRAAL